MRKIFFLFLFFLLVSSPLKAVFAEDGIVVTPAFEEVILNPGEAEKKVEVTLENHSEETLTARLQVLDFGSLDESGGVAFLGAESELERRYSLASWMRPETDVLTLSPGESKSLSLTIENRESLSPGGHYGALIFRFGSEGGNVSDANPVAVHQVFSSLFFVKKVGGEIYRMELRERNMKKSLFFVPRSATLRFENSGNIHVVPRGIIRIQDPFGRDVSKGILNQESALLLPESFRVYPVVLEPLAKAFLPGKYTVSIEYRYDGREAFETETENFFLIPPLFMLGMAFLLFVAISLFVYYRSQNWAKKGSL